MGLPNKLRPFSKPPKSPSSVADHPPPVFNKHQEDVLLKGHKAKEKVQQTQHEAAPPPKSSNHSTSSTELWIAASNAAAARKTHARRPSTQSQNSYMEEVVDDDSYEEEIIEEEIIEEEIVDENSLPPRKITIRFDEYDEMQTCLHINDYTKHEIGRTWYKREDYDKMVSLARKTAQKVEERQKELGKLDKKVSRKIESRGLEAWTAFGAAKVKILKESAVEAVWNEQSRQWDAGITDADAIREVYQAVSKGSITTAQDRGFSDALISKRIRQLEEEELEKKQRRKLLGKSKALAGKTLKVTKGGVVKTAKLAGKTTKLTGKVALKTGRVATKTAVATATLDRKMLKEAIIPNNKKKQCETQILRRPSQAQTVDSDDVSHTSAEDSVSSEKKKKKMKLLGMVPIPGTKKTYREDRRQARADKRKEKQNMRPSWEAGVSAGKY